jgi:hypothetical protein
MLLGAHLNFQHLWQGVCIRSRSMNDLDSWQCEYHTTSLPYKDSLSPWLTSRSLCFQVDTGANGPEKQSYQQKQPIETARVPGNKTGILWLVPSTRRIRLTLLFSQYHSSKMIEFEQFKSHALIKSDALIDSYKLQQFTLSHIFGSLRGIDGTCQIGCTSVT